MESYVMEPWLLPWLKTVCTNIFNFCICLHQIKHVSGLTLPEGQEDDRLDNAEFENWVIGAKQLLSSKVEQQQSIQGQADGDVVDDGDVEVATHRSGHTKYILLTYTMYTMFTSIHTLYLGRHTVYG